MNKEQRYDSLYMDIAKRCAEMSYAVRAKVGCVLVRNGRILSQGWNGTPAGMSNTCEYKEYEEYFKPQWEDLHQAEIESIYPYIDDAGRYYLKTKPEVSHAEENALLKLTRSSETSEGATAYVTLQPCINCSKLLYNAGIVRVVYGEQYRDQSGVLLLGSMRVETVYFNSSIR